MVQKNGDESHGTKQIALNKSKFFVEWVEISIVCVCVFVGAMKSPSFQIVVLVWQNFRSNAQKIDYNHTWNFRLCEIIARSWNNTFFRCLGYFLLFSKNNAVSCLGFWLLGNACQPDLFFRFLGGKLRFLDGKLRRFKCLSALWWEVQVPKTSQNQKTLGGRKKCKFPKKAIISEKAKI